ncbi:MAG TPA: murein L,D-transpeptidase catalytic domain family protein [Puia sp.]|nr:murein L,D-transpeptidase catalytic domain family protein [Puia sp.]
MRVLTNLLFKVAVSSMVLTAPAMIDGHANDGGIVLDKGAESPFAASIVIRNYIDHLRIWPVRAYMDPESRVESFPYTSGKPEVAASGTEGAKVAVAPEGVKAAVVREGVKVAVAREGAKVAKVVEAPPAPMMPMPMMPMPASAVKAAEIRRVLHESEYIYMSMGLDKEGLSETAFEFAWRGYHNLVKKGSIRKKSVLSIADFSQSSSEKRMYVIDIRHRRLLYRTYVAHGQNSGAEYAETFSNEPESFMSSLGFYITKTTYVGKNGLSLRLDGVDDGYNDKAMMRNIVLHGCSYVGERYLESFGSTGTSLGCPAVPAAISSRIIRAVKGGSCLFIYHPTQEYLDHSVVING